MSGLSALGKFAVYGTGLKTRELIAVHCDQIVGLMDRLKTGETVFGKRVLSETEVAKSGIKAIVIAARRENVPVIYRRIAAFCRENDIAVYDAGGEPVKEKKSTKSLDFCISDKAAIKEKILSADVVSFDVFDTLIVRNCLYPDDVFEIAGTGDTANGYEKIFEAEYSLARSRKEVAALYEYAFSCGKSVYLTTDMYLKAADIGRILEKCGICVKTDNIIVSDEYGVSKVNGLFDVLKDRCGHVKILHIGDNYEADYLAAREYGIDGILVESRLSILEHSRYADILWHDGTLEKRCRIGEWLASASIDSVIIVYPERLFL